jgi:hypothetical protein
MDRRRRMRMKRDERRCHPRVDIAANAVMCIPDGRAIAYAVEDLSVGGALLRGQPIEPGQMVRVALELESGASVVVSAELVRHGRRDAFGPTLAVAFRDLNEGQEGFLENAVLTALEALNGPKSAVRGAPAPEEGAGSVTGAR